MTERDLKSGLEKRLKGLSLVPTQPVIPRNVPSLRSIPPARSSGLPETAPEKVGGLRSKFAVGVASILMGATGATVLIQKCDRDEKEHKAALAQPAPSAAPSAAGQKPVGQAQKPAPASTSEQPPETADSPVPRNAEELVDALKKAGSYPTEADFKKSPYRPGKLMSAIKLIKLPIAPYPDGNEGAMQDASSYSPFIFEWKPMNSGNGNWTFLMEPETAIAIKLKDPKYAKFLKFEGLWKPVITHWDSANDIIILLYNNCVVNPDDLHITDKVKEDMKVRNPKYGGVSSIVIVSPDDPNVNLDIFPLKIFPCVKPQDAQ